MSVNLGVLSEEKAVLEAVVTGSFHIWTSTIVDQLCSWAFQQVSTFLGSSPNGCIWKDVHALTKKSFDRRAGTKKIKTFLQTSRAYLLRLICSSSQNHSWFLANKTLHFDYTNTYSIIRHTNHHPESPDHYPRDCSDICMQVKAAILTVLGETTRSIWSVAIPSIRRSRLSRNVLLNTSDAHTSYI